MRGEKNKDISLFLLAINQNSDRLNDGSASSARFDPDDIYKLGHVNIVTTNGAPVHIDHVDITTDLSLAHLLGDTVLACALPAKKPGTDPDLADIKETFNGLLDIYPELHSPSGLNKPLDSRDSTRRSTRSPIIRTMQPIREEAPPVSMDPSIPGNKYNHCLESFWFIKTTPSAFRDVFFIVSVKLQLISTAPMYLTG